MLTHCALRPKTGKDVVLRAMDFGLGHPAQGLGPCSHHLKEGPLPAVEREKGFARPWRPLPEETPRLVALAKERSS